MITKKEIVSNWLPRYTGVDLEDFGQYILLTNFSDYVNGKHCYFTKRHKQEGGVRTIVISASVLGACQGNSDYEVCNSPAKYTIR